MSRLKWGMKAVVFVAALLSISIKCHAYFGKNSDYVLVSEKPEGKVGGDYLEFVSNEIYRVEGGDTLWKIAKSHWGSGALYQQILADNPDVVKAPELLMPGTELALKRNFYTSVGVADFIDSRVFRDVMLLEAEAFRMDKFSPPYRIFLSVPYLNDLQDADPYVNWEEFQKEVTACSKEICGERVSDLAFERYQVTRFGSLCGYSFSFDAGDKEYMIMAYFCYNDERKSEAFALCDKDYCTEKQLEEIKGKVFYGVVRYLDPGTYYVKTQDYIGWEDWNYPQLRNPFTDAMEHLYTGPLEQAEHDPNDVILQWKEPAFEKLVREELADLWQLTPEEKQAFMERDMTAGDLSKIEKLKISYFPENSETEEFLCVQLNGHTEGRELGATVSEERSETPKLLNTLDDLKNFPELKKLDIRLFDSNITDLSCIGELTNLQILNCNISSREVQVENIDFLGNLVNLRTLCLGGWGLGEITFFFNGVTDLSVLSNCPHLAYLTLLTGNVESYDFLKTLPEIYYFRLDSAGKCMNIKPDESLLPNACFISLYGEDVRFEIGEGYGMRYN